MMPVKLDQSVLLVVDAQNGFTELCPEELPVPGGLAIVEPINRLLQCSWKRIDASQDWHPANHCSFRGQRDNLYPPHCVAGTRGAEFLPGLHTNSFHRIFRKGFDPGFEAYALTAQHPGYPDLLRAEGIETVAICGLARNICCFFVARDLRQAGFRVLMPEEASAGIDVPEAGLFQDRAWQEGMSLGIEYVSTRELLRGLRV